MHLSFSLSLVECHKPSKLKEEATFSYPLTILIIFGYFVWKPNFGNPNPKFGNPKPKFCYIRRVRGSFPRGGAHCYPSFLLKVSPPPLIRI